MVSRKKKKILYATNNSLKRSSNPHKLVLLSQKVLEKVREMKIIEFSEV